MRHCPILQGDHQDLISHKANVSKRVQTQVQQGLALKMVEGWGKLKRGEVLGKAGGEAGTGCEIRANID